MAAFGVSGCAQDAPPAAVSALPTPSTTRAAAPAAAPLPSPDALADVLYRLADTSIPAARKVALVQYATVDDEPALDDFAKAMKDNGFDPLTVQVADLAWAGVPGHVTATVTMGAADPNVNAFTFPMEFSPMRNTWQLSRRTADQLLPGMNPAQPTPTG